MAARMDSELKLQLESLVASGIVKALRDVGLNKEDTVEVFELRKDLTFLREQRRTCDEIKKKGIWYIISLALLGTVGLLVIGFKGWIHVP